MNKRQEALAAGLVWLLCAAVPNVAAGEVSATLDWYQRTALGTPVSGTVNEVPVEAGSVVSEGDILLRLDPERFEARVARATSRVERWEKREARTRRDWERAEELYARGVLSDQELERAETDHVDAESSLREARAELTLAEVDLRYASIQAPFAARVLDVLVRPGQTVVSELQSEPLIVLAHRDRMIARAMVPWEALDGLERDQPARVTVDDERFEGRVTRLGLEAAGELDDGEPAYPVEVVFDSPPALRLRSGQSATVEFE